MLDRLYKKFDALSQKHDVFKLETIGDTWLGVSNLAKEQEEDHIQRVAQFSLDAMQAANETLIDLDDPEKGYVQISIGFHCGPVVASVLGSRLPRFCVFGDTMNLAARMASTAQAGRIHCSKRAAILLLQQSPKMLLMRREGPTETFWLARGEVQIKGKDGIEESFLVL